MRGVMQCLAALGFLGIGAARAEDPATVPGTLEIGVIDGQQPEREERIRVNTPAIHYTFTTRGATLSRAVLQDERFIKWKPTVLYVGMAVVLAAALWGWKKNFLQMLLGSQLNLPEAVWARLTVAWVGYFLFMAAINAWFAAYQTTEQWVNFKLWGYVFPVLFIVAQGLYIARHIKDEEPRSEAGPP